MQRSSGATGSTETSLSAMQHEECAKRVLDLGPSLKDNPRIIVEVCFDAFGR